MVSQAFLYIGAIFIGYDQAAKHISWFGLAFFAGPFYIAFLKLQSVLQFLKKKKGDSFLICRGKEFGSILILGLPLLVVLAITIALIIIEWVLRGINGLVVGVCRWVLKEMPSEDILGGIGRIRKLPESVLKPYDIALPQDRKVSEAIMELKSKKAPVPMLGIVGVVLVTIGFILELL